MRLTLSDRAMLIARMQVYAHSNVMLGDYIKAETIADDCLERFNDILLHNPTNSAGWWSNFYYDRFVQDIEQMNGVNND